MVSSIASTSFVTLALCAALTHAAPSAPHARRAAPSGLSMKASGTGVRIMDLGASSAGGSGSDGGEAVTDVQDVLYKIEIGLAGGTYVVQMDTGSADLWIYAPNDNLKLTNQSGITTNLTYGTGSAEGEIVFGELRLGNYTIPSQAFVSASSAEDFSFFDQGVVGILGLSFDDTNLSPINAAIEDAWGSSSTLGRTPISSIFAQDPSVPDSFDIQLDRSSDLDDTSTGTFLISEHLDDFANITSQPQLPRQAVGRWSVPLDGMSVNGQVFAFGPSSISTVPAGKIAALLDTGYSFPPLPPDAVDAIYSTVPGAVKFSDSIPQWLVPCDAGTNVTFTLGGKPFPVHPLDLTAVGQTVVTQNGQDQNVTYCYNSYQYLDLDPTDFSGFDAILGDAFLRNVYASFNYGGSPSSGNESFVQLISTTDLDAAWPDFAASRAQTLAALPPTIDPATLASLVNGDDGDTTDDSVAGADAVSSSVSASSTVPSTSTTAVRGTSLPTGAASSAGDSADDKLYALVDKYGPVIVGLLAGNIVVGVILCAIALAACMRGVVKGGAQTRNINSSYAPVRFKEAEVHGGGDSRSYQD